MFKKKQNVIVKYLRTKKISRDLRDNISFYINLYRWLSIIFQKLKYWSTLFLNWEHLFLKTE